MSGDDAPCRAHGLTRRRARRKALRIDTARQHPHLLVAHTDLVQQLARVRAVGQDGAIGARAALHQRLSLPAERGFQPLGRIPAAIPLVQPPLQSRMTDDAAAETIGIRNPRPLHVVADGTTDDGHAEFGAEQAVVHVRRVNQRHRRPAQRRQQQAMVGPEPDPAQDAVHGIRGLSIELAGRRRQVRVIAAIGEHADGMARVVQRLCEELGMRLHPADAGRELRQDQGEARRRVTWRHLYSSRHDCRSSPVAMRARRVLIHTATMPGNFRRPTHVDPR